MADEFLDDAGQGGMDISFDSEDPQDTLEGIDSIGSDVNQNLAGVSMPDDGSGIYESIDNRVRLRAFRAQEDQVYGSDTPDNILAILRSTDGLLFPYTPTISVTQAVDYKNIDLVHSNGDILTYNRTPSVGLSVSGDFTVQSQQEGTYALAVLHFLRVVSKMYFGEIDKASKKAGLPPPVLIFTGYGSYVFNNLPVILKSHSYTFDKSMNMVNVETWNGGTVSIPAMFSISMELQVQQTPQAMRKSFSLDTFRTGELMRSRKTDSGWI